MLGKLLVVIYNIGLALSYVLAHEVDHQASPIFQNFFRSLIPAIIFTLIVIIFGVFIYMSLLSWDIILMLFVAESFLVILGDTFYLKSQKCIGSTKAITITTTTPFFTMLFTIIFLNRFTSLPFIFSGILIALGVIIMMREHDFDVREDKTMIAEENNSTEIIENTHFLKQKFMGFVLAFLTAISWSLGFVFFDYSFNKVNEILDQGILNMIFALMISFWFSTVVLGVGVWKNERENFISKTKRTWKLMIIAVFLGNVIGGLLFSVSIMLAGATFMSLITTALPLFTFPFAYFINKEKISMYAFLGIVITIIGVLVALFFLSTSY